MFIACYRTSILGIGEDEQSALAQALALLMTLGRSETKHAIKRLRVYPLSQTAAAAYAKDKYVSLVLINGVGEAA